MAWSRGWLAPAKLNLFLHITGRRADGYHDLQTVFQLLDVGDRLDFRLARDGDLAVTCNDSTLAGEGNLVWRAATALRDRVPGPEGVHIHLEKVLPAGGGVGGGSSDAATALLVLNALWQLDLSLDDLAEIGRDIGADVPVFVRGFTAFAEGIGDRLTPIELPQRHYLVMHAGVAVATAPLFRSEELTRDCPPITIADFTGAGGSNVFEPLVRDRHTEIDVGMRWLDDQGALHPSRLTGTGGCFFAVFEDSETPEKVLASAPQPLRGFVAKGLARSPVHDRLQLHGVS